MFHTAAYTGARRGKLLYLRWADVDLEAPELVVRGSAGVIDRERVEGTTKGGRSRRVSLDDGTAEVLAEHRRAQGQNRLIVGPEWHDEDYVFSTGYGYPLHPDTVSQSFTRVLAKLNEQRVGAGDEPLPRARLHDLRHVHATTLLLAGVPVHVVADRLGHADPSVTLRRYAHVLHEHSVGVADVFARAVSGAAQGAESEQRGRAS